MTAWIESVGLDQMNELSVCIRLVLAALYGGLLGIERVRKRKGAGIRTYALVCLGSAIVMMVGTYATERAGMGDPTRIGAQVVSGIGFIGAGTIMVTGYQQIRGLTTAAALWATACMGLAIGIGFYFGATVLFLIIFVLMTFVESLQERYIAKINRISLYILFSKPEYMSGFMIFCHEHGMQIRDFHTAGNVAGGAAGAVYFLKTQRKQAHTEIIELLSTAEGVLYVDEV